MSLIICKSVRVKFIFINRKFVFINRGVRNSLVPRPSPHVRERGSGVLSDFLVKWGGVAPRSESSNQIAERLIIWVLNTFTSFDAPLRGVCGWSMH